MALVDTGEPSLMDPSPPVVMSGTRKDPAPVMLKLTLFRPVWLPTTITAGVLLVALLLLFRLSWQSFHRLEPVYDHMAGIRTLEGVVSRLEGLLLDRLSGRAPPGPEALAEIRRDTEKLRNLRALRVHDTLSRVEGGLQALMVPDPDPDEVLGAAVREIRGALAAENAAKDRVLHDIRERAALELEISAAAIVVFPLLVLVTLFLLRKRIVGPLQAIAELMSHLGQRDFTAAHRGPVDPLVEPLVSNYNHLVGRLAALEAENAARRESLESQVRAATQALLEQQRDLANAERLASVGEVAAGLAHELRNPLAGIKVAIANLREDTEEPDHADRLGLVIDEVSRVTSTLNEFLDHSRHTPEQSVDLGLADVLDELLVLVRYQLPGGLEVRNEVPRGLRCHLPERRTRQAVLNLVLNAAAVIGEHGGHIAIGAEQVEGQLTISVRDDGPGFPRSILDDGVTPFATRRRGGTGLGLAMVRRFAADLGGRIELANREQGGARVSLHLPCET